MLKSKFIKTLSLTGAILFAQTAWATPPSDELIAKYNQVYKVAEQTRQDMIAEVMLYVKTGILQRQPNRNIPLNAKQQEQLNTIIDEYAQKTAELLFPDDTIKKMQFEFDEVLKKHYTAEEVQAMIDFAMTPIGQRIVEKQSAYALDVYQLSSRTLNDLMAETYPKIAPEAEKQAKISVEKMAQIWKEAQKEQNNIEKAKPSQKKN